MLDAESKNTNLEVDKAMDAAATASGLFSVKSANSGESRLGFKPLSWSLYQCFCLLY